MIRTFALMLSVCLSSTLLATPQILNIGNGSEPKDLDPHILTGVPENSIVCALFEGLVVLHPETLEPLPGTAESWTISKDQKKYLFKLRKNAVWTNGDPVTAKDFVYSWTRLLTPKTASEYAYQGYYFKNGEKFHKKQISDPAQLGFKAIDDWTLEVELESPTPFFLSLLYHYSMFPVPRKAIEKHGANWTKPGNIVTNGAFVLDRWEMNKVISVKKSPTYWDQASVKLDVVNFHPIENLNTEEAMFRSGQLHVTYNVPLEKIPLWKRDTRGVYRQAPYLGIYFYRVNVTKPPFNDKKVRRALAMTIDREQLVNFVTKAGEIAATAFTPPGTGIGENKYTPTPALNTKVTPEIKAEAKKLLAEAGYPDGKGMPPIVIQYNTADNHKKIAEAVRNMWETNLGVKAELFNLEWKAYLAAQQTLQYQLSRSGWIGDYNDPLTFLDLFVSDGGNNQTGWKSSQYDQWVSEVRRTVDPTKRKELFQKLEILLMEELPVIPLYVYTRPYLRDPSLQGWYDNILHWHPLKFVSFGGKRSS